jgi:hypothetical protein
LIPIASGGTGTTLPNVSIGDIPIITSLTPTTFGVISRPTYTNAILGKNGAGVIDWYTTLTMNAPFSMGTVSPAPTTLGYVYFNTVSATTPTALTIGNGTTADTIVRSTGTPTSGYVLTATGPGSIATYQAAAGGGNVSNSGTPALHQWGIWTDATHVKAVAVTGSKVACTDANGEPIACTNLTDLAFSSYAPLNSPTFTGTVVLPASTSFTTPNIGAATGTSLIVTGVIDGLTSVVTTTLTTVSVESPERMSIYIYNNPTTPSAGVTFTLPSASVAGKGRCYANETGVTSAMTFNTSGAGQYIGVNGVNTASGGYITMAGALGDAVCFTSKDSTHWKAWVSHGADPSVH